MKFMLNGAPTLGTMDGANVEIVEEVGAENAFIFGLSSDEVINYENNGGYDPMQYFNNDPDIRNVLMQLINGTYSNGDFNMFHEIYDSLLNTNCSDRADTYFYPGRLQVLCRSTEEGGSCLQRQRRMGEDGSSEYCQCR
mgnify:FL=1